MGPGERLIAKAGGLHEFMAWDGPILTDSGGFQVFSLPQKEIEPEGVRFKSEIDGSELLLTPERAIEIQHALGADIIMAFDECTPYPAQEKLARTGVRRTLSWIERCMSAHGRQKDQALFGIVQGSTYLHLRESCAQSLVSMDLPGYAIGGVSVGEGHERVEPEGAGTALDRVHGPKHHVDGLIVGGTVVHRLQPVLQRFEQFLAFDEERGADFCHRVGHWRYPATILSALTSFTGSNGLTIQPVAPAARARAFMSAALSVVSTRIGTARNSSRDRTASMKPNAASFSVLVRTRIPRCPVCAGIFRFRWRPSTRST